MGAQPTLHSTVSNGTLAVKMSRSKRMSILDTLELILDHDSEVKEDVSEAEDHAEISSASSLYKRRIFQEEIVVPHVQRRQHMPRTPAAAAKVSDIQERTAPGTPANEVKCNGYVCEYVVCHKISKKTVK